MNEEIKKWLDSQQPMLDKVNESNIYAGIVSPGFLTDPMCALQLGFAILKNKPIFLLVDKDLTIPESLVKVAKIIERIDRNDPDDIERAAQSMGEFAKGFRK